MHLKALITMLVLGASSAAVAAPVVSANANVEASWSTGYRSGGQYRTPNWQRDRGRDYGYQPDRRRPSTPANVKHNSDSSEYIGPIYPMSRWNDGWSALTDPTRIELTRQIVRVNGRFDALMLQNMTGSSSIRLVKIRFKDGGLDQTIMLNQNLNNYRSSIRLDVQRRPIEYIVVYGTSSFNSTYRVLGT
jgi:hypothetical protein